MLLALVAAAVAAEPRHLSMEEALAMLERENPGLARAEAQARAAHAASLQAVSAVMPTLTGSGQYVRNNEEVTLDLTPLWDFLASMGQDVESTGPVVLQPLDAVTGTATVRVPLVAPSAWASISGASHAAKAADAGETATRSATRAAALQAFWAEASAEGYVGTQEASAGRARELAALAQRSLDAGATTKLALLQAQTEVARREGDLLTAKASLEKARVAVGVLLGLPEPVAVDLPAAASAGAVDAESEVEAAWSSRGEVAAAEEQVAAARMQALSAKLGVLPTASGSFSAFASTEPYPTGDKTGWKATVDLTWPIVQGGARLAAVQRANATLADAEAALDAAKLAVAQQVRNAAADLDVAKARLELAGQQRALAEEAARVAQRSFAEGALDSAGVLDALDRLDLARVAEVDATARLGIADANLRAATGRW